MKKDMFDKINLGGIDIKNRFVRSATVEFLSKDGLVTDELVKIYEDLSKGDIGLIITSMVYAYKGDYNPKTMRLSEDIHIEEFKKLTEVVHKHGSKIIPQLAHASTQTRYEEGRIYWSPSNVVDLSSKIQGTPMTKEDINILVEAFGDAAVRAKKAGCDGVEIHGAHGYLLSKFLCPYYNKRTDEYGGSIENRSRIIVEIIKNIKSKTGSEFPVFIKVNCSDFLEQDNFTLEDCIEAVKIFEKAGVDAVEVSGAVVGGTKRTIQKRIDSYEDEGYFSKYAIELASQISIPVFTVGGYRSLEKCNDIIQNRNIEAISLCRAFISEPDLVKRWSEGNTEKSRCISCNKCFNPKGIKCVLNT